MKPYRTIIQTTERRWSNLKGMSGFKSWACLRKFRYYVCSDGTVNPQKLDAACPLCLTDSDCSGDATRSGASATRTLGQFSCPSCLKTSCCYDHDADNENAMFAQCVAKKETFPQDHSHERRWCVVQRHGLRAFEQQQRPCPQLAPPDSTNRSRIPSVLGFGDLPITDSQLWTDQDGNYIGVSSKQDPQQLAALARPARWTLAFSSLKENRVDNEGRRDAGADTSGTTDIPLSTSACESLNDQRFRWFRGGVGLENKEPALFRDRQRGGPLAESGGDR